MYFHRQDTSISRHSNLRKEKKYQKLQNKHQEIRKPKIQIGNTNTKTNTKYENEIQNINTKCEIRNTKYPKLRKYKYEIQKPKIK